MILQLPFDIQANPSGLGDIGNALSDFAQGFAGTGQWAVIGIIIVGMCVFLLAKTAIHASGGSE